MLLEPIGPILFIVGTLTLACCFAARLVIGKLCFDKRLVPFLEYQLEDARRFSNGSRTAYTEKGFIATTGLDPFSKYYFHPSVGKNFRIPRFSKAEKIIDKWFKNNPVEGNDLFRGF